MQMNNTQMPQAAKNQQPQDTEQTYAVTVDAVSYTHLRAHET